MNKRSGFINFLIGPDWIPDRIEYKQAILRGQLGLLVIGICLFYLVVDPLNGIFMFMPLYLFTSIVGVLVIYFNRIRKYTLSSIILMVFSNLLVFVIADVGNPERGVFLFFIVSAVTGLVLFYHTNLKLGLVFVLLSMGLAMLAYYHDFHLFDRLPDEGKLGKINFTVNFLLGMASSVLVVLFVIRRNNESEQSLISKKEELENLTHKLQEKNVELQKANEELDKFVYSASHDLRAPLSTLLGLIEVIKVTNNEKEIPEYLTMMSKRIHDMEGFIRDVTDYSRNSRLGLLQEQLGLRGFIEDIVSSFNFETEGAQIDIQLTIDPELVITTDPNRLKVVVNNLLNNAIKYHDPQKEQPFVRITTFKDSGYCRLIIEDNGIGIAPEYQTRIFDMFFRATEQSTGSGLGLYILKETLERIGGKISFESVFGQGSKFIVELPAI